MIPSIDEMTIIENVQEFIIDFEIRDYMTLCNLIRHKQIPHTTFAHTRWENLDNDGQIDWLLWHATVVEYANHFVQFIARGK